MKLWQRWLRAGLLILLGMVLGAVTSHALMRWYFSHALRNQPQALQQIIVRRLTCSLRLTREQQAAIRPIVAEQVQTLLDLRKQHQPTVDAVFQKAADAMQPHLTQKQREQLAEMRERFRQHRMLGRHPPRRRLCH